MHLGKENCRINTTPKSEKPQCSTKTHQSGTIRQPTTHKTPETGVRQTHLEHVYDLQLTNYYQKSGASLQKCVSEIARLVHLAY